MTTILFSRPEKAAVRAWLARRRLASGPPPCPEEIRRTLGWRAAEGGAPACPDVVPALRTTVKN